jgi:hypothetical protein
MQPHSGRPPCGRFVGLSSASSRTTGAASARGSLGTIYVNGQKVAEGRIERTQPITFSADKGAHVGEDGETPVVGNYGIRAPCKFTGTIARVTVDLKEMKATDKAAADTVHAEAALKKAASDRVVRAIGMNWVQAVPGKDWNTLLRSYSRSYSPLESWFDKTWRPGEVDEVSSQRGFSRVGEILGRTNTHEAEHGVRRSR